MPFAARCTQRRCFVAVWTVCLCSLLSYSLWSCGSFAHGSHRGSTTLSVANSQHLSHVAAAGNPRAPAPYLPDVEGICLYKDIRNRHNHHPGIPESAPGPQEVQAVFEGQWGSQSCVVLQNACMDEGTFVVFGTTTPLVHHPVSNISSSSSSMQTRLGSETPWQKFHLSANHLDFGAVGDVAGIIRYPTPIIRPCGPDEESPDLHQPVSFSPIIRPVVLYLNFLYMFGDWWLRTMPTFMHAMAAGAWNPQYHIVVATGGQKLSRWQKLLLQTLTVHPVITLSTASSRGAAAQRGKVGFKAVDPDVPGERQCARCFELLTLCSITDAKRFPTKADMPTTSSSSSDSGSSSSNNSSSSDSGSSSVPRETWSSAQWVRNFYMQRYGQQYSHLPQRYTRLKEQGALRVVFAVRARPDSTGSDEYSTAADPTLSQLATSTRQVLNIQQLLQWCNDWTPTAAQVGDLDGIDGSSQATIQAAAAAAGQLPWRHTVCVAHEFGQHGKVHTQPQTSGHSSSSSSSWGSRVPGQLQGVRPADSSHPQDEDKQQQELWPWHDPDLDPRALMVDLEVMNNADIVVGLHGAQLYNALFMPPHKALVEVRPYGFWGGWPKTYFQDPFVNVDKDDGTLWFGIDTVNTTNSKPGRWEREHVGVPGTYARDRHTHMEPAALETMFRRILWAGEDTAAYKELKYAGLTHITDTLQPAQTFHAARERAEAAARHQAMKQHLERPEIAAAVQAAKADVAP